MGGSAGHLRNHRQRAGSQQFRLGVLHPQIRGGQFFVEAHGRGAYLGIGDFESDCAGQSAEFFAGAAEALSLARRGREDRSAQVAIAVDQGHRPIRRLAQPIQQLARQVIGA